VNKVGRSQVLTLKEMGYEKEVVRPEIVTAVNPTKSNDLCLKCEVKRPMTSPEINSPKSLKVLSWTATPF
jgi:hypothetical protein